ncbi:hypothetical protein MMC26_007805, partial [Xylographa opegraphella]|nr:hypothetical protein [Xylographa opegraphella]
MNESGFAPAKNPHLNIQPDGGTGGTVMVPSLVDDTEYFYDSSAATRENLLPLENQSVDIIASHEAKTSKPIYDLPGAHQSHSKAGGECTSKDSRVNYFSKQQVNTNRSTTLKTTFSSYENIGGNGAKVSEILGLCNRTERSNMDDEDVAVNPSLGRSSTVGSRRDFGLLKIVKDSDRNIDSILSGINGGQDTQGGLYLTQSPLSQTTPGISAACIVKQPSSEPGFGAADACEPPDKPQKQSQSPLKTQNGTTTGATDIVDSTKAVKHVLMQANKLNTDPQIERSTLADGGFAVSDEPKMTENSMLLNLEDGEPEKTSATVKDEEIDSGGAKTLDCDLQMPSIAEAEFELDSSPWESSLGSSPNATSDDSSENDYEMLDPAEQARRLMQEDGGSEDGRGNKCTVNRPLRTLHEEPDEIVEKPNVAVTANMRIEPLGWVETLVENLVLVKAKTTGEHQVLETGSVLCLQDRTVIGVIAETLGRVQQPLYSIRFTNAAAIEQAGISKGTYIYYAPQYSTYVFTQTLKACKGSDASNIHDEEVGDDELEFSDDEIEAEHKRNLKLHRQGRRGERQSASNRSARAAWPNDPRKIGMEIQNSGD